MTIQPFERRAWESLVGRTMDCSPDQTDYCKKVYVAGLDADLGVTLVSAEDHNVYIHCFSMHKTMTVLTGDKEWWRKHYETEAKRDACGNHMLRVMAHMIRTNTYNTDVWFSHLERYKKTSRDGNHPSAKSCPFNQ